MSAKCTLPIHFHGPMMSFGTEDAREGNRPTDRMPRKSAVVGILAAALGRSRDEDITDLADLLFGTIAINPGNMEKDFHRVDYKEGSKEKTIIGQRGYITDADFIACVEGEREFIEELHEALLYPRWPLYMGRSSCPAPPDFAMDIVDKPLRETLLSFVPENGANIRIETRGEGGNLILNDRPISFKQGMKKFGSTVYTEEFVKSEKISDEETDFFAFV